MNDVDAARLSELLCARLCHDLAGAVGAIGTGVELLGDDGTVVDAEALALLAGSAAAANSRLKYLRIALGSGGAMVADADLRQMIVDFLATQMDGREALRLDWGIVGASALGSEGGKLLLNFVLLARDCLSRGGVIRVEAPKDGTTLLRVTAQGDRAAAGEAVLALSAACVSHLKPRGAQGYYTTLLAQRMDVAIKYEDSLGQVVFIATRH